MFFGCSSLDGAQAEYVRIPLSEASVYKVPEGTLKENMLLLSDIFSTGYSCAYNAKKLLDEAPIEEIIPGSVAVVYGCGPVGLCAISSAKTMFETVFAFDPNEERRKVGEKHGAIGCDAQELVDKVMQSTQGRGADAAFDLVGGEKVLNQCLNIIRSYGAVSSIGMQPKKGEMDFPLLYEKK